MSEELICITCPLGCHLTIDRGPEETLAVSGNRCPRGVRYAEEELLAPKRVVSATARIDGATIAGSISRVPVRTTGPYPKDGVPEALAVIYALSVKLPVRRGQVLVTNLGGQGVDVIATRSLADGMQ
jgi:CxxC motif-containing protein